MRFPRGILQPQPNPKKVAFSAWFGNWHGNRVATNPKIAAAIRAKLVTGIHAALALPTDGIQSALASRAKAKAGFDDRAALRTAQVTWFPQNEIEDDPECVWDEKGEQRPTKTAHVAATSVSVDITDEQDVTRDSSSCDDCKRHHHEHRQGRSSIIPG